jgi:hypothetical protein
MSHRFVHLALLAGLAGSSVQAGPHTNLAHYRFDNDGPALADDTSTNGHHFNGSSSWGTPLHAFDPDAQVGSDAARFHGLSSVTLAPPGAAFDSISAAFARSFTVSLWLKTTTVHGTDANDARAGAGILWGYASGTNDVIPVALTGNLVAFQADDGDGNPETLHSTSSVTDGDYHHVVVTRDRETGEKQIFVDGVLEAQAVGTTNLLNANNYCLSLGGVLSNAFDGLVDDLQIYAGVLNPTEVNFLYTHPGSVVTDTTGGVFNFSLNTSNLVWTTGGDAGWFVQLTQTRDGNSAAQSGPIGDDTDSYLETTVTGPGRLQFWWMVSSEDIFDFLEFRIDDVEQDAISGEVAWEPATYSVGPGLHTFRWRYVKDIITSDGLDAGFLDEVSFAVPVQFSLTLSRQQNHAFDPAAPDQAYYLASPSLDAPDVPVSHHRVESPTGLCHGLFGPTNAYHTSCSPMASFAALATELTNGNWKLWLNKGTPLEQFYTFTLNTLNLASNDLPAFQIHSPTNGSRGPVAEPPFEWAGLSGWDEVQVTLRQVRFGTNYDYASEILTADATNWLSVPPVDEGTNSLDVTFRRSGQETNFSFSMPYAGWSVSNITYETTMRSGFVVVYPALPVQLLDPVATAGSIQFQFLSEPGRTNTVQSCTNLTLGIWQDRTNWPGDGTLQTVILPGGDLPAEYFRIRTQ